MKALVMNCSPVKNGATAEIVNVVSECLNKKHEVRSICIDDFYINFVKVVELVITRLNAYNRTMLIK